MLSKKIATQLSPCVPLFPSSILSSTAGYCQYNSYVYPPHQQKFHQTAPTNITLSTSCSYSAPIITTRTLPLTATQTLHTVLPPFNQFFSYPNNSLPPTADTSNPGSRTILTSSAGKENVSLLMDDLHSF